MKQSFKEYIENRVSKENLERDLATYKGCTLEKIYCHHYEFYTRQENKDLYKIEIAKTSQTIYVASDSEEQAIVKVKSDGNGHRIIDSIEKLTKSHNMFIIDN